MSEVDFETKLKGCAMAFFEENRHDEDYPWKTWQEQAKELRENASKEFIEKCWEMNTVYYLDLMNKQTHH